VLKDRLSKVAATVRRSRDRAALAHNVCCLLLLLFITAGKNVIQMTHRPQTYLSVSVRSVARVNQAILLQQQQHGCHAEYGLATSAMQFQAAGDWSGCGGRDIYLSLQPLYLAPPLTTVCKQSSDRFEPIAA